MLKNSILNNNIEKNVELDNIVEMLVNHANEIERRSVVRVNELVELLKEGTLKDVDMWHCISKYFEESNYDNNKNENEDVDENNYLNFKNKSNDHHRNDHKNTVFFDEKTWLIITNLIDNEILPRDDAYLITRFATGVNSPRLRKLKLTRHISFGIMVHCEWNEILKRVNEYIY